MCAASFALADGRYSTSPLTFAQWENEKTLTAPLAPRTEAVVYVGGEADAALLDQLGVVYAKGAGPTAA